MAQPAPNIFKGHDSFGPYRLVTSDEPLGRCSYCNERVRVWMHYWTVRFPADIKPKHTILKRPRNPLGIDCGCYGKLHRQVTHIAESGFRKGFPA